MACLLLAAPVAGQTTGPKKAGQRILQIDPADKTKSIRFDSKRLPKSASFIVSVNPVSSTAPPKLIGVIRGDLVSEEKRHIPVSDANIIVHPDGVNAFSISAQVDPKGATAGRYTTTAQLGGPGYSNALPVTIVATLRDSKGGALLLMLLGWLLGVIFKMCVDLFRADGEKIRSTASMRTWFARKGIIAVALLGLIGGLVAWALAYLPNHTWGAGGADQVRLVAAAFAGVVVGATLSDAFAPFKPA